MNANQKSRFPRRRFVFMCVAILLVVGFLLLISGGGGKIEVSKQTTWIESPVDEQGNVDYLAHVNQRNAAKTTTDENAAIDYYRILGPQSYSDEERKSLAELLGVDPFANPETNPRILKTDGDFWNDPPVKPWTSDKHPDMSAWLQDMDELLDETVEASKKPGFFMPLIDPGIAPRLINSRLSLVEYSRKLAHALYQRSLLRLGEGEVQGAQDDIQAIHRLARHIAHAPGLVSQLFAIAIERIALDGDRFLIESRQLSAEQMAERGQTLLAMLPVGDMRKELGEFERLFLLDVMQSLATDEFDSIGGEDEFLSSIRYLAGMVDWNLALSDMNIWIDQMVKALETSDPVERRKRFDDVQTRLEAVQDDLSPGLWILSLSARSQKMADIVAAMLLPAYQKAVDAEDVVLMERELTAVAAALHAYQKDNNEFPESLDALTPDYLKSVPTDRFQSNGSLTYRLTESGFVLYSWGADLEDDEGSEDNRSGDLVIKWERGED